MDLLEVIAAQRDCFKAGDLQKVESRKAILVKIKSLILENESSITEAIWKDLHKNRTAAFLSEYGLVLREIDHAIKHIKKWMKPKRVKDSLLTFPSRSYLQPEPYGNTLIISPWNYPFQLAVNPIIGAIAAGNTAILKPSEHASATSAVVTTLFNENFDPGIIYVAEGGVEVSKTLLDQRFDYIFFTGSIQVGKIVAKAAADYLTPVSLELGWKSPAIVDDTANIDLAAKRITFAKWLNAGQTCVAPDYVYVHNAVKDDLADRISRYIHQFYGDYDYSDEYSKIIHEPHFDRIASFLRGQKVLHGGELNREKLLIQPTLLEVPNWDSPVMQEEIFGPVLPILSFSEPGEVIELLKHKEKPLAAYIFSSNKRNQNLFTNGISCGAMAVNDAISQFSSLDLPFGGVGVSGYGAYHGKYSFDTFSHNKGILKAGTWLDVPLRYPPYSDSKLKWLKRAFKF